MLTNLNAVQPLGDLARQQQAQAMAMPTAQLPEMDVPDETDDLTPAAPMARKAAMPVGAPAPAAPAAPMTWAEMQAHFPLAMQHLSQGMDGAK